jgi:hypothetical protein
MLKSLPKNWKYIILMFTVYCLLFTQWYLLSGGDLFLRTCRSRVLPAVTWRITCVQSWRSRDPFNSNDVSSVVFLRPVYLQENTFDCAIQYKHSRQLLKLCLRQPTYRHLSHRSNFCLTKYFVRTSGCRSIST